MDKIFGIIVFPFLAFPVTGMVNIGDFYSVSYSIFAGKLIHWESTVSVNGPE